MSSSVASRAPNGRALLPALSPKSERAGPSGAALASALCAVAVGGCAPGFTADGPRVATTTCQDGSDHPAAEPGTASAPTGA